VDAMPIKIQKDGFEACAPPEYVGYVYRKVNNQSFGSKKETNRKL
jgi:hypothetical protein